MLEATDIDILFAPPVEEMYPNCNDRVTWVVVEGLSEKLDGRSRPGHFRGVATIVSKLFHILEPDSAFFGQKDAAQLAVISYGKDRPAGDQHDEACWQKNRRIHIVASAR